MRRKEGMTDKANTKCPLAILWRGHKNWHYYIRTVYRLISWKFAYIEPYIWGFVTIKILIYNHQLFSNTNEDDSFSFIINWFVCCLRFGRCLSLCVSFCLSSSHNFFKSYFSGSGRYTLLSKLLQATYVFLKHSTTYNTWIYHHKVLQTSYDSALSKQVYWQV